VKTILVIEDEPEMRRNLVTLLKLESYRSLVAADGTAGLNLARRERPDLIVCDVMMPGLDGHGVLLALRQAPETAPIPFIFLTAKGDRTDLRDGMNLGADDFAGAHQTEARTDFVAKLGLDCLMRGSRH
jgi:CheY-like chemotaxis protein